MQIRNPSSCRSPPSGRVKRTRCRIVTKAISTRLSATDIDDLAFVDMSVPKLAKLAVKALCYLAKRAADASGTSDPESILDVLQAQRRAEHDLLLIGSYHATCILDNLRAGCLAARNGIGNFSRTCSD
jgi:hypothetical protein